MKLALWVVLLGTALSASPAPPTIHLKADPLVAFFPAPLQLTATVQPHPDVRSAVLTTSFTSSFWQIDGDRDQRIDRRQFTWRIPEPGEHTIVFAVFDSTGRQLAARTVTIRRVVPE